MCGAIPTLCEVCGQWWRIQRLCDCDDSTPEKDGE